MRDTFRIHADDPDAVVLLIYLFQFCRSNYEILYPFIGGSIQQRLNAGAIVIYGEIELNSGMG